MNTSLAPRNASHVNILNLRMGHHAGPSGYDRLVDNVDANIVVPGNTLPLRILAKLFNRVVMRSGSLWYNRASSQTEIIAAAKWLTKNDQIFHFLYGENTHRYLGNLKSIWPRRNKIVCTYHTPIWRLKEVVLNQKHIEKIDAAIVVSTSQKEYFVQMLGESRVHYVPHGIDTNYFSPGETPPVAKHKNIKFVTVGFHLRDFEILASVSKAVYEKFPEAEFVVVSRPDRIGPLKGLPNVNCISGISDDELRDLYRSSSALLLPLRDATANNSLMEGMACGLPVISADIVGVRDYVNKQCSVLCPKDDVDAYLNAVQQICEGKMDLLAMGQASRNRIMLFDWSKVGAMMNKVYAKIMDLDR